MALTLAAPETRPTNVVPQPLPRVRRSWPVAGDSLVVGAIAAVVAFAFIWVPSLWFDETATVVAATRSWSQLGSMIGTVDIVHAAYYAFMHVWFDVFGYSPVSLRMPSVLATGVAAGLTVTLGRIMINRTTGIVAGLLFLILPRVTWMGTEGRSFAISTMVSVGATLLFVVAWRRTVAGRTSARWWVAYAFAAVLSSVIFIYAALMLLAHGTSALIGLLRLHRRGAERQRLRRVAGRWLLAAVVTAAACAPLAVLAKAQTTQISWIKKPTWGSLKSILVTQWFSGNVGFAIFAWALVLLGIVVAVRIRSRDFRNTLVVMLPLIIVPTAFLIVVSLVASPMYSPRYLTMGAPYVAILMAAGIAAIPRRRLIATVIAAGVALTVPTYYEQRQPTAKDAAAWNQVAALITAERASEITGTRDAVVFGPVRRHPAATSRIIEDAYPAAFAGMTDLTLKTPGALTDGLWDVNLPIADALAGAVDSDVVYLVTSDKQDRRPVVAAGLAALGFHVDKEWDFSRTNVVRYER